MTLLTTPTKYRNNFNAQCNMNPILKTLSNRLLFNPISIQTKKKLIGVYKYRSSLGEINSFRIGLYRNFYYK